MAIIKCKMCGGDLNIEAGMTVAECEYCPHAPDRAHGGTTKRN